MTKCPNRVCRYCGETHPAGVSVLCCEEPRTDECGDEGRVCCECEHEAQAEWLKTRTFVGLPKPTQEQEQEWRALK